jgi:hypothetical protein
MNVFTEYSVAIIRIVRTRSKEVRREYLFSRLNSIWKYFSLSFSEDISSFFVIPSFFTSGPSPPPSPSCSPPPPPGYQADKAVFPWCLSDDMFVWIMLGGAPFQPVLRKIQVT